MNNTNETPARQKNSVEFGMTTSHTPRDNLLGSVHLLSNQISRAFFEQVESKHGITLAEWRVILTLKQSPGATATEITAQWAMEKMAMNRAIRHLQQMGCVQRKPNKQDRRSYVLSLSKKGERLYTKIIPDANRRYAEIIACLSKSELAMLRKLIVKLNRHTGQLQD